MLLRILYGGCLIIKISINYYDKKYKLFIKLENFIYLILDIFMPDKQ